VSRALGRAPGGPEAQAPRRRGAESGACSGEPGEDTCLLWATTQPQSAAFSLKALQEPRAARCWLVASASWRLSSAGFTAGLEGGSMSTTNAPFEGSADFGRWRARARVGRLTTRLDELHPAVRVSRLQGLVALGIALVSLQQIKWMPPG